jgi:hypothetical protein
MSRIGRTTAMLAVLTALVLVGGAEAGPAAAQGGGDELVSAQGDRLMLGGQPLFMRGFNYFPRDYGWTSMVDWDWDEVDAELALAQEYGANTVRTGFDYAYLTGDLYCRSPLTRYQVLPEYLDAIDRFLTIAASHDLKVVFWLGAGPCWGQLWNPADYGIVEQHLESLIPRFAGDPRIAAWDLATDLDSTMLGAPPSGAHGAYPQATRDNMVTLLENMAGTVRRLDPDHLLTVGFSWPSSSLLVQDFTDFLMPQFFGADAPNVLSADQVAQVEPYVDWGEYSADPEAVVAQLGDEISRLQEGLRRPMPIVLAEYGSPSRGSGYSESFQQHVYEATLEVALLRLELAGVLNWALTDFIWPPQAFTTVGPGGAQYTVEEQSFGAFDVDYAPKPAAEVARAYYAERPEIGLSTTPTELSFHFGTSFVPAGVDPTSEDRRRLSAAFDWIEFRDEEGQPLLTLDVGTPEARPYLGQGFYEDEGPWEQDAETFVWAGGEDLTGRVEVAFPEGARSVAFRAFTDSTQRVEVSADGLPIGAVTMNPGWRAYTVGLPVPESPSLGDAWTGRGALNLPISTGAVVLQVSYDGSTWTDAGSTTPERGRFTAEVTFEHGGRVLIRPAWSGAGLYGPAVGAAQEITVAALPSSIALTDVTETVSVGRESVLGGRFSPPAAGLELAVTFTDPRGSQIEQTTATGSDGSFELAFTPDEAGTWAWNATWLGNNDYQASEATATILVVVPAVEATSTLTTNAPPSGGASGAIVGVGVGVGVVALSGLGFVILIRRRRGGPPS